MILTLAPRARRTLCRTPPSPAKLLRLMATVRSSLPHEDRTAAEPRENRIESVILSQIRQINDDIRLLRLSAVDPNHSIAFSPGQWLDTYIPGIPKAGGFTITSTPREARPSTHSAPYLELAIQKSRNPPAQWLWQPEQDILGSRLAVRVGGSFIWPPPQLETSRINRLVLIAGGVGIKYPFQSTALTSQLTCSQPPRFHLFPSLSDFLQAKGNPLHLHHKSRRRP